MSLGRKVAENTDVRDIEADYVNAYLAEYNAYCGAGLDEKADEVANILDAMGHPVKAKAKKTPAKQRAIAADTTEKAVEGDANPK